MTSNGLFSWARLALIAGFTFVCVGCKLSDGGATSHLPPDQFFAVFALDHHAINLSMMAPYNTVALNTVARMADGNPVPGEITYRVSNPAISVTGGILKAESAVSRAVVLLTLTYGTVTRTDSAIVSVIATAPTPLSDFGIRVPATDSAKVGLGAIKTLPLIRQSQSGSTLSDLQISLRSSDTTVAKITQSEDEVNITSIRPGRVVLYASTFAFGVEQNDSLVFTVGWPLLFHLPTVETFKPRSSLKILDFFHQNITVGVGGCVVWTNRSLALDIDVQFDDTAHVAPAGACGWVLILDRNTGGNIAPYRAVAWDGTDEGYVPFLFSPYQARTFSAPGLYPYRSSIHGTQGVVRVCDEHNDTTCAPQGIGAWY